MNFITDFINNTQILGYIVIALAIIVIILIILTSVLFRSLRSVEDKYRKFMRGVSNENVEELIMGYLDKVDEAKQISEETKEMCKDINSRLKYCIQKISIIRYRAFENVGSDLSFSIALLDENNSGVMITSIYGRNESTTYAKPIDKGLSRYDMSSEEKQALQGAINKK